MTREKHALIFGASGIQGWAIVNELLHGYPTLESFSRVTALTHRPLPDRILWPKSPKLLIRSGINLLGNNVKQDLEEKVPTIGTVTHIFFTAYVHHEDPQQEISINVRTLGNAITAVEKLSKNLESVVLATGMKAYGLHLMKDFPYRDRLPLSEDLPRIPEPWCSQLFYYFQTDFLAERSRGKAWTNCELRPDTIVGFVPNNNAFCLPQTLARFLALYREMKGEGAECPFPGSEGAWRCLANDSGQDSIARFAIHAALHPQVCGGGQAFNIASHSVPASWVEKWPMACEFFGLIGTPHIPEGGEVASQYLARHSAERERMEQEHRLTTGHADISKTSLMIDMGIMSMMDFDRQANLSKAHQAWSLGGNVEELNNQNIWWTAFQRFRDARVIP